MPRLREQAFRGLVWSGTGRAAHGLIQIGVLAVLARLLTPSEFGLMGAALVVVGFANILSQLGVAPALVQRRDVDPSHLSSALYFSVLLGSSLGLIIWTFSDGVGAFFDMPELGRVLKVLSFLFPIVGVSSVSDAVLHRELEFRWLAVREVFCYSIGYGGVAIVLAALGYGVWALVVGHLTSASLRTLVVCIARPIPTKAPSFTALRELLDFGTGFTLARVFNYIALQGDNIVVARLLGAVALGVYGRAYQLMVTPISVFGQVLDKVLFPTLARAQDRPDRLQAGLVEGTVILATMMVPISAVMIVLAPEIVTLLLGGGWERVIVPLQVLACALTFRATFKVNDAIARATGAVYRRAWRQFVYAMLVVMLSAFGSHWGVPGVAAGVLMAIAISSALMTDLSLRITMFRPLAYLLLYAAPARLGIVVGIGCWVTAHLLRSLAAGPFIVALGTVGCGLTLVLGGIRIRRQWFLRPEFISAMEFAIEQMRGRQSSVSRTI